LIASNQSPAIALGACTAAFRPMLAARPATTPTAATPSTAAVLDFPALDLLASAALPASSGLGAAGLRVRDLGVLPSALLAMIFGLPIIDISPG
jgi:hypothetical protein